MTRRIRPQPAHIKWPFDEKTAEGIEKNFRTLFQDTKQLSDVVPVELGGTGQTDFDAGDILYAPEDGVVDGLAISTTSGRFLRTDGSLPEWSILVLPNAATQGDLLYANATNALVVLAKDANATRYLSNQGTSNSPSWNQVNLTNGVTGILPVANGGTGTTAFTLGSVVFAGTSGVYTQDNSNLFWDDTNNRLGIGINASFAASKLHVVGVVSAADLALFSAASSSTNLGNDWGQATLHNPNTTANNYVSLYFSSIHADNSFLYGATLQTLFTSHTNGAGTAELIFKTRDAGTLTERARLNSVGLTLAQQIKISGGSPGTGKVLTSDSVGLATWETATGGSQWSVLTNGDPVSPEIIFAGGDVVMLEF